MEIQRKIAARLFMNCFLITTFTINICRFVLWANAITLEWCERRTPHLCDVLDLNPGRDFRCTWPTLVMSAHAAFLLLFKVKEYNVKTTSWVILNNLIRLYSATWLASFILISQIANKMLNVLTLVSVFSGFNLKFWFVSVLCEGLVRLEVYRPNCLTL